MSNAHSFAVQFPLRWEPETVEAPAPTAQPLVRPDVARLREALTRSGVASLASGTELIRAREHERRDAFATGVTSFDRLLDGGLHRGKLTEIVGARSSGRFSVVLSALAVVTSAGEAAALIDLGDSLDPQCLAEAGADLPRVLWVRPRSLKHAVASAEMLIATGFPLVAVDLGARVRGRRVADAAWVRLARSAAAHGAALLIASPFHISGTAADALVRASRPRAQWSGRGRTPRLLRGITAPWVLEKHRRLRPGAQEEVAHVSG
ncbi:MAG: P-loop NTPase family protein [Thermoanaerobaculia bacterium]